MTVYNADSGNLQNVAFFGATARIGRNTSSHFLVGAQSLEAYNNESTPKLYFRVNADGIFFGEGEDDRGATMPELTSQIGDLLEQLGVLSSYVSGDSVTGLLSTINNDLYIVSPNYSTVRDAVNRYLGNNKVLYWDGGNNLTLKSNSFNININNTAMNFRYNNSIVASIDNNLKFNSNNIIINSSEQLGTKFKWVVSSDKNRLTLMRI